VIGSRRCSTRYIRLEPFEVPALGTFTTVPNRRMSDSSHTHRIARGLNVLAREAASANATTTKGAAAASTTTKAKAKAIEYVKTTTGFWHWYIVAGIVGALTILNLMRLGHAYLQRQRALRLRQEGKSAEPGAATRAWGASSAVVNNFLYVRSFPVALYKGTNVSEVFFSLAYLGVCLGLTMYKTYRECPKLRCGGGLADVQSWAGGTSSCHSA